MTRCALSVSENLWLSRGEHQVSRLHAYNRESRGLELRVEAVIGPARASVGRLFCVYRLAWRPDTTRRGLDGLTRFPAVCALVGLE